MKKFISLFLCIVVVLSMLTSFIGFAADIIKLSESFENGMGQFLPYASSSEEYIKIVEDKATDGKRSVYILDESDKLPIGIKTDYIDAVEFKKYSVSADLKETTGTVKLYIKFYDSDKKEIKSKSLQAKAGDSTLSGAEIAPEGAKYMSLLIVTNGSTVGSTYVDNVKISESEKAVPKEEATAKLEVKEQIVVESLNGESFESGLGDFVQIGINSLNTSIISDKKASDGKQSVYIYDNSDALAPGVKSPYVKAKPYTEYTVGGEFIDITGTVKIYIKFFDENKKELKSKSNTVKTGTGGYSLFDISPDKTAYVTMIISTNLASTGEGYADKLYVKEGKDLTPNEQTKALMSALPELKAGDVLEIEDGEYANLQVELNENAPADKPIIIKAKNPGKVTFTGETAFIVRGSNYQFHGLKFEGCTTSTIIRFDVYSDNCVVSECAFLNNNPLSGMQFWISLKGKNTKIKDSFFFGKESTGQFIESSKSEATKDTPDNHEITGCYFGNIKYQTVNGYEAIRLGLSHICFEDASIVVEGCFFENCHGDSETISVKTGGNIIRYNTFYNNKGSVTLRHGNGSSVYGNVFIGGERNSRTHGVGVIGERHKVYNNYFYNMPETSETLSIDDGNPYEGIENDWYYPVVDFEGYNNTFVGGEVAISAGNYRPHSTPRSSKTVAPKGKIYNNAIISYSGALPLIKNGDPKHELVFENNYAYGKPLGYEGDLTGITNKTFGYSVVDGFVVPDNGIGADINEIKKAPKSPYDVLCDWVKRDYYDTGIMKFTPVEGDFFNTDATVYDIIPKGNDVNVVINGKVKAFDVEPQLINERTMVPMRAIFEEFGAEVGWDEPSATATAKTLITTVKITENSTKAYVDDKEVTLDSPAVIVNGRFLVPLRFVSEAFGAKVSWADETQTAIINYNESEAARAKGTYLVSHGKENALPVFDIKVGGFNEEGNDVWNVFDGDFVTKWTTKPDENGVEGYGIFDLKEVRTLDKLYLAFNVGSERTYKTSVLVSEDGENFVTVLDKTPSPLPTNELQEFDLGSANARFIKIIGHGSQVNIWHNINEMVITGK